ncbi:MAG: DUF456 domain-containing protein [Planctomycetota bacterium]
MVTILLVTLGAVFLLAGLAGCILPALPGPPLAYLALIFVSIAQDWETFSPLFLIGWGAGAVLVTLVDMVVPIWGAKRYGASKSGIWGSILGLLVGLFFFPPFGFLLGAWLGAIVGELAAGKQGSKALRASWGVFVGTMAGVALKLAYCIWVGVEFVLAVVG